MIYSPVITLFTGLRAHAVPPTSDKRNLIDRIELEVVS